MHLMHHASNENGKTKTTIPNPMYKPKFGIRPPAKINLSCDCDVTDLTGCKSANIYNQNQS